MPAGRRVMNRLVISEDLTLRLRDHLFRGDLEEAAFLFAHHRSSDENVLLEAIDAYLVPPEGWIAQQSDYLELLDTQRSHVLKLARAGSFALVDCHSHRGKDSGVFSPSDRRGIAEFADYVRWKLNGLPYIATVWSENGVDAAVWHDGFNTAERLHELVLNGPNGGASMPRFTWLRSDCR